MQVEPKVKATQSEVKAILRSVAILSYLQEQFYEKYPDGIPELLEIENLIDGDKSEGFNASAETLVEEAISDLLWIAEKYK